jgi:phosphohistidine phosphatase SixA
MPSPDTPILRSGPDDAKRPLTEGGIRKFEAAAEGLLRLVPVVDVVLSSGYARAWETAELLHKQKCIPALGRRAEDPRAVGRASR